MTHKYARVELERRVRLRYQAQRGGETIYKLTQKVPARGPHGEQGTLTTFYLSPEEHDVFAALPGARLRKTRLSIAPFGVDVFAGPLEGSCSPRRSSRRSGRPRRSYPRRSAWPR